MKKRLIITVLAMTLVSLLAACGSSKKKEPEYEDPVYSAFYQALRLDPEEAEIREDEKWDYIEIKYDVTVTPYDYTDYVSTGLSDFIKTGKIIFETTDCVTLRMDMLVDGYAATSFIMTKENFNKHDWENMAFTKGIYYRIVDDFDKFYVEGMLKKDVDFDSVEYNNNMRR